jgi:microcystin-dependent protein
MAQPYVGEIRIFAGSFAPAGWAMCDGSMLAISENETLFQLIGTTYGGDGQSTFGLPDLRGRHPMHQGTNLGQSFVMGELVGVEQVTLTTQTMPSHTHQFLVANTAGDAITPSGNLNSQGVNVKLFYNGDPDGAFNAAAVSPVGGSQPHENRQPYLGLNFIVSLFGIFPSPT